MLDKYQLKYATNNTKEATNSHDQILCINRNEYLHSYKKKQNTDYNYNVSKFDDVNILNNPPKGRLQFMIWNVKAYTKLLLDFYAKFNDYIKLFDIVIATIS